MKMFARKNQVVGGIGKCMINRSLYERQTPFNIIYIMRTNMNPWEIYTLSVVIALVIEPTESTFQTLFIIFSFQVASLVRYTSSLLAPSHCFPVAIQNSET